MKLPIYLALVLVCFFETAAYATSPKPNIILFLIDDQDKSSIAAYGGNTYTPNFDQMAAEGMKFNRAYVSSAVCTPSRYGWATGRYAGCSTSKRYDDACGGLNRQGDPNFNMALETDRMNIGNVLREAGYATGWVGKFHLESELDFPQFFRGDDGFKKISKTAPAGPQTSALFVHNEQVLRRYIEQLGFSWAKHVYAGNLEPPYNHHNPEWTEEAALEFIEENKDRPFYLHYCPTLLHGGTGSWRKSMDFPLVSGEGELKSAPNVMTPRAELLETLKQHGVDPRSATAGEAWIDDALGVLLRKLKELGIDDNTFVLFAPDHGSRGKSSLFSQDGVCIPMIARWPGHIKAGATCDELVQNVDWVPTVLELAGVNKPEAFRTNGISFLPLLLGNKKQTREHVYLEMGCARGIATKGWKYIAVRYPQEQIDVIKRSSPDRLPRLMSYIGRLGIGTRGSEHPGFWDADQLYNLESDPDELVNLATEPRYAEQLQHMRELLTVELNAVGRPFGEFLPGGNAAPSGQVDSQITLVKTMTIDGKTVIMPADQNNKNRSSQSGSTPRRRTKMKTNDE